MFLNLQFFREILTTINIAMKNRAADNIGLAIWRLKCFYETFVQGSTAVILLNFCAKSPPHRQAENRYIKLSEKFIGKHGENLQFCRSLENLVVFRNY